MTTHTWARRPLWWVVIVLLGWLTIATLAVHFRTPPSGGTLDESQAAPELGVLVSDHMQVLAVDPYSAAARAGLQRGDVIKELGGKLLPSAVIVASPDAPIPAVVPSAISTTADLRALFHAAVPTWEHAVTVVVQRQGRVMALPVLVTAKPYNYDPSNPLPTVTPVPASMDDSAFYF